MSWLLSRPLAATSLCLLLAACQPATRDAGPGALRAVQSFATLDRFVACVRDSRPEGLVAVPPDRRLIAFSLHGNGLRQVSVVGLRKPDFALDVVSWQTGRAHVLQRRADAPPAVPDPACQSTFRRRADIAKAIERLDPASLSEASVRNAIGETPVLGFTTRGRTRTCLYFTQSFRNPAPDAAAPPRTTTISGMDCRHLDANARDRQWGDLIPVVESIRAG